MKFDARVVVVGLGAVGSAALLSLASRGVDCIGIDRFDPPHTRGSSHGLSRLIRLCYYEHPDYVPLLVESYRAWNELALETNRRLMDLTGGLYIGRSGDPFVAGSLRTALERGLKHELLFPDQVRSRFPLIRIHDEEVAFYEPTTGVLYPERCIEASLNLAKSRGARVITNARIEAWDHHAHGVSIDTHSDSFRAESVILCAGAWMKSLVPMLAEPLSVTRQVLAWFQPRRPESLASGFLPSWSVSRQDGAAHYGFPIVPPDGCEALGGRGFKLALHSSGPAADPESHRVEVDQSEVEGLKQFLSDRFPCAFDPDPLLLDARACMYTNTPDHHFLLDKHPDSDRVIVVSACSGHGFKLSPAIGRAAADLAVDGSTSLPIGFLSWRPCLRSP